MNALTNSQLLFDTITEESIKCLVLKFYEKIKLDKYLSPIFSQVIGTEHEIWDKHLHKMMLFWSSVMLKSKKYEGNPFLKHKNLPPFNLVLFDKWLELFEETVREIHPLEIALQYIEKSKLIAESLKSGLFQTINRV